MTLLGEQQQGAGSAGKPWRAYAGLTQVPQVCNCALVSVPVGALKAKSGVCPEGQHQQQRPLRHVKLSTAELRTACGAGINNYMRLLFYESTATAVAVATVAAVAVATTTTTRLLFYESTATAVGSPQRWQQ